MSDLRFVNVSDTEGLGIQVATPKGTIRHIPLTTEQALTVIRDLAGYLRTKAARGDESEDTDD